jgi:hypothetical protein
MLVSTAVQAVIDQLDVGEGRYPANVALMHVNQALVDMSREYQFPYDNTMTSYDISTALVEDQDAEWQRFPGSARMRSVLVDDFLIPDFVRGAWLDPSGANTRLNEPEFNEAMDHYGDRQGIPEAFFIDGNRIYWRPIPAPGDPTHVIRFSWKGFPRDFVGNEEPLWLIWAPYAVIYKACEIASVWLLEDQRVPAFQALRKDQMQNIDVTNSMRGDSIPTAAEEPG